MENLEDQASDSGLRGVHVWEGAPQAYGDSLDELRFELTDGFWREPTDAEWVALKACRSPFNSEADDLQSLVE